MPKIDIVTLSCLDPRAQCEFYCSVLGMRDFGDFTVGYCGEDEAKLRFVPCDHALQSQSDDLYWKIALAVPNIELACHQLAEQGVDVGQPHQFQEVGYLAHFNDPEGYTIELIDHWFEGMRPDIGIDRDLFGGGAHFNLLTLRARDMDPIHELCSQLDMTPLAVQPVETHNFTLYFFAFTSEQPPISELRAVENRPWLYQRPYTVLEIQHVPALTSVNSSVSGAAGYRGTLLAGLKTSIPFNDLMLGNM